MDDLQRFRETYITECFELLAEMEEKLLGLDAATASSEDLNAIFRCAHSIKGGAGAFGLVGIGRFTHTLEALLDRLREGQMAATRDVIDTLLKARDVVMHMVTAAQAGTELPADFGGDVAAMLSRFCGQPAPQSAEPIAAKSATVLPTDAVRYRIRFAPHRDMLLRGSEPLLLLRELKKLGDCQVVADVSAVPALIGLDPESVYLSWEIVLTTDRDLAVIHEVFEFVDGECALSIAEDADALDAGATLVPRRLWRMPLCLLLRQRLSSRSRGLPRLRQQRQQLLRPQSASISTRWIA